MTAPTPRRRCLAVLRIAVVPALAFVSLVSARAARADGGAEVFALIVTNNRSLSEERPDLQYADDDGARYHALFRSIAPAERVTLLSTFDPPTARLYPALARTIAAPTRAEVLAAARRIGTAVRTAKAAGRRTALYFVFAGHGDVRGGRGFLELADARFGPRDIERHLLDVVPADAVHLVIDSCNSFFVINPRKPGGRRWASPRDVRAGFSKRYPHVGAFLSTSAEGEVFEWSEIQGGIFSHEVRSGLSGAADADGNGVITYEELAAFVEAANARIRNAHYRPKVFARGPFAKASAPLFESRSATGRRIQLDAQARRLWVRDRDGTRLIDVHKEAGAPLTLVLPVSGDEPLYVQEQRERVATRRKILQWTLPPGVATFVLAAVEPAPAPESARGADAVFRRLFAKPFGPSYFAAFRARPAEREEVYGISAREGVRIRHYLRHFAGASKRSRRVEGILAGASSALMLGLGSALYADRRAIGASVPLFTVGAVLGAMSAYQLATGSEGERLYELYRWAFRMPGVDRDALTAKMESRLEDLVEEERLDRKWASLALFSLGGLSFATTLTLSVGFKLPSPDALYLTGMLGASASFVLWGAAVRAGEAASERVLRLYRADPDLQQRVRLGVAPLPGGAALTLSGAF